MAIVTDIIGSMSDPAIAERLHRLEHAGRLETATLSRADLARRRLRVTTDAGADLPIALSRDVALFDGAVLVLEETRAVVLRMAAETWLRLAPRDAAAALALGYHAGNLHWRVRFDGATLAIALDGPRETYLARLETLIAGGEAVLLEDEDRSEAAA